MDCETVTPQKIAIRYGTTQHGTGVGTGSSRGRYDKMRLRAMRCNATMDERENKSLGVRFKVQVLVLVGSD